ncbi:MAG: hypothetical protein QF521_23400 [Alphaproteobacteria bacterium]|jgi:hypothetical protein|nr:hypothetical protein [Alphaproteobacteria bacterium]
MMASETPTFPAALALGQVPSLKLDYFKPAAWLPMTVRYPVGLALIGAVVVLAAVVMGRLR